MPDKHKVLLAIIEVSDQYSKSETKVVGVFSDNQSVEQAKEHVLMKIPNKRIAFDVVEVLPNMIYI